MQTHHPTYSAHIGVNQDETGIDLIVRRAVPAGIDGPFDGTELSTMDLAGAEAWLSQNGYVLAEPWQFVKAYDGLRLSTTLVRS